MQVSMELTTFIGIHVAVPFIGAIAFAMLCLRMRKLGRAIAADFALPDFVLSDRRLAADVSDGALLEMVGDGIPRGGLFAVDRPYPHRRCGLPAAQAPRSFSLPSNRIRSQHCL